MINEQEQKNHPTGLKESLGFIQRLAAEGFFGTVELRFEAGNVVHLVEHRSLKPTSLTTPDKLECANGSPIKASQE